MTKQTEAREPDRPLALSSSAVFGPKVWARKDQLQHASARGGLLCAMYPDTKGRADLEPLYDAATVRAMVEGAWCAGYYHDGYKNDGAYASAQAEATADELLGPNAR
jgi:hypothetical protein